MDHENVNLKKPYVETGNYCMTKTLLKEGENHLFHQKISMKITRVRKCILMKMKNFVMIL